MIVLSNSAAQTIAAGQSVIFDTVVVKTGCAEYHRGNSSSVQLCSGNGVYSLSFSGNITNSSGTDSVQLAIATGGDTLSETQMISTPAVAGNYNNVSSETIIRNGCCAANNRITVTNTGTVSLSLAPNCALVVKRLGQVIKMAHHCSDLCNIKDRLVELTKEAIAYDIQCIDTHEMGEIIDMIKDLSQAIYYDSVVESMQISQGDYIYEESDARDYMTQGLNVDNMAKNVKRIWEEADPNHKTILKSNLQQLLMEMDRG